MESVKQKITVDVRNLVRSNNFVQLAKLEESTGILDDLWDILIEQIRNKIRIQIRMKLYQ